VIAVCAQCQGQINPVRIMPLGDSITAGDTTFGTWRSWLWNDLTTAGYNVDFVGSLSGVHGGPANPSNFDLDHEGHFAWKTDQFFPFIAGWVTTHNPDIVLVHLGTNDFQAGETVASTLGDLGQLVLLIRQAQPNVTILLAQVIPSTLATIQQNILSLDAQIPALAAALSTPASPVKAVDQLTGFNAALDTYDGLHPHTFGNWKMAARWIRALAAEIGGLHLSLTQSLGPGSAVIRNLGGVPFSEYLTVFTFDSANAGAAFGTGWFGGLTISFNEVVAQYLIGAPPFYGILDVQGSSQTTFPPGILTGLTGTTIYATSHVIITASATFVESSPPVALLFP